MLPITQCLMSSGYNKVLMAHYFELSKYQHFQVPFQNYPTSYLQLSNFFAIPMVAREE